MNEVCEEYVKVVEQMKLLEERRKYLGERLLKEMDHDGVTRVQVDNNVISMAQRPRWTYSKVVKTMNDNLVAQKRKEEENGTAQAKITKFLKVTLK